MTWKNKKQGYKPKIFKITIILFLTISLPQIPAQYTVNSMDYNNYQYHQKLKNKIGENVGEIYGTVLEAVCCIPEPLENAQVTAIKIGSFGLVKYQTNTDENGNYTLTPSPGLYRIFAHKEEYRRSRPLLWWILFVTSDNRYERNFILVI